MLPYNYIHKCYTTILILIQVSFLQLSLHHLQMTCKFVAYFFIYLFYFHLFAKLQSSFQMPFDRFDKALNIRYFRKCNRSWKNDNWIFQLKPEINWNTNHTEIQVKTECYTQFNEQVEIHFIIFHIKPFTSFKLFFSFLFIFFKRYLMVWCNLYGE